MVEVEIEIVPSEKKTDSLYWDHPVRRESAKMVERTDQMVLILKFKGCCDRVAPNTQGSRGVNGVNIIKGKMNHLPPLWLSFAYV